MKTIKIVLLLIALLIVSLGYAQQTLIENFDATPEAYTFAGFEKLGSATIASDPVSGGTRGNGLKLVSSSAGNPWQGAEVILSSNIRLNATDRTMKVDIYSTQAFTMMGKVEQGGTATISATSVSYTTPNEWQTLIFTFNTSTDNTGIANGDYAKIAFFPGRNSTNTGWATPANFTVYVDNITGVKVSTAPASVTPVAPTPTTPNAQVFSLFGDTGGFTNKWIPDYSFGGFLTKPDLDPTAGVNTAIKMDFSTQGYGEGLDPNVARKDVSAYGFLYFDYYVKSGNDNVGSLGHQFYIDLISRIGTTNTEGFYAIGSTVLTTGPASEQVAKAIVFDSWQTVSVPLSAFVGGFSPANFFQWKIGASSDLRTKVAFFDNIYFSNNPPPTPSPTASAQTFCGSATVSSLVATGTDLKWYTTPIGETALVSDVVLDPGTYYVSQTLNNLESDRTPVAVTVSPLPTTPTISVSGSTTLCQGESVILTSSSPSGNTWSNGATNQSITVTQSGSYSVSVSNGNCSSTSSPVAVTVIPLPNNPIILSSGPTSFCEGGAVTLNLNNLSAVRYLKFESYYSSDSGQVNVNEIQAFSNGINVALNKPGYANSYEYGDWSSNGANAVDGDKWNRWSSNRNDPGPDVNNPHYIVVDLQSQFNLESVLLDINNFQQTFSFKVSQDGTNWIEIGSGNSVSGSFTYTPPIINYSGLLWSNGATTQSITVSNSGSYSVKAFIGSTCSVTSNAIAVTVNPLPTTPTISASGSTTFCQGESVVLTSSSPSGNTWSNGATTQSITVTESGSYSVSVSNDDCSATSNPVVVTVSPLPIILTISASGSTALCQGASIILTSSTPSGNTWSNGETTQSITVSNSGFYSVKSLGVCANATGNDTATVTVTELIVPSKPVTSAVTYCQYQTAIALTASEITTATTNWYDDPSAVTPYPNAPTPSTDTVGTFDYYVSQTSDNGCESDRVLMEVTVYPIFDVSICYVSSDETETIRNRIFINNNGNYNVDKYQIFREGDASGIYDLIGEIPSNENSFLDLEADNSASSYKYKVKTKDISGLVSNDSSIHKTILLQSSLATNNNVNLSWTTYDGIGYGTYTIYRKVNDGVFEFLKSTSASNLSYTDVTANTSENKYSYYVSIAVNPCSTSLSTKWSNRNAAVTTQIRSNYKTILKQGALSTEDNTIDLNIKVYPNPTSKLLYVSHPEQKNFSVRISDLTGKQMYSGTITTATPLDIAKYPQGMYLVTVTSKETNQKNSYKILKK